MIRYISICLMLLGCTTARPAPTPVAPAADPEVLLERDRAFDQAAEQKGIEGFMEFIGDDVALLPPGEFIQHGRDAIRMHWQDALADKGSIRWRPIEARIAASGDLGWTIGTYEIHKTTGGEKIDRYGKYLTLWRKDREGKWKVVGDLGSPSPSPGESK